MAKKDIVKKKKNEVIREAQIDGENPNKFNDKLKIVAGSLLIILAIVCAFLGKNNNIKNVKKENDISKFKEEYEEYNNKKNDSGTEYLNVEVSTKNNVKYSSYDEVFSLLENGTGVIYFGFPTCPWCRNLVPVLLDSQLEAGLDKIYYLNNKEDRDTKVLENGKIITEKEGTDNYKKLLEKLDPVLGEYKELEDSSIKRLYFPTVIFVKDGKIVDSHIGTVSSQENPYIALTESQYNELKEDLTDKMLKTITCDSAC